MKNKLISTQCISILFFINPALATDYDHENIVLNGETLELSDADKKKGIAADNKSKVYLYEHAETYRTTLEGGSIEYANDNAQTHHTTVRGDGSRQYGYGDAHLYGTVLRDGGQQWLNEDSIATGTDIGAGSSQYLSGRAITINTVITDGAQYISGLGATSEGTKLYGNSLQQLTGGTADGTELYGSSSQTLQFQSYAPGQVTNTTLNDNSVQYVFFEHSTAIGSRLNDNSRQYVYFGSQVYDTSINGGHQIVYTNGYAHNTIIYDGIQSVVDKATISDTTLYGGYTYLYEGASSTGYMNVYGQGHVYMDHGSYAENINLDHATLFVTDIGEQSPASSAARIDNLAMNDGVVSFLRDSEGQFTPLNIGTLSGTGLFLFNSSLAERNANFVTIDNGHGRFGISVTDAGKEIVDHAGLTVNLIHDKGGELDFSMVTSQGRNARAVDGGTYMYTLYSAQDKDELNGGNVWYLGAINDDSDNGENGNGDKLVTTPAADAVLSLATAGLNVMRGELDALRAYRQNQTPMSGQGEGNVWGHYLGKKSAVDTSNDAAYKLYQNGFELGGDMITRVANGNLVTGGFVTLSDNKVNHARGGKSRVDSYGLGAYASWYDNRGFYVAGATKFNRLETHLNARMTNGGNTSGSWHQYGIISDLEAGFTFKPTGMLIVEPFIRTTGTHINNASVALTNGMQAETGKARSLTAEAGARVGSVFSLRHATVEPYLRAGIEQEFVKSNQTTINGVNRFDNNLNGTSGKYGAGVSAQLGRNVTVYGEINYRQGSHIEEPVQGTAGIRIGF